MAYHYAWGMLSSILHAVLQTYNWKFMERPQPNTCVIDFEATSTPPEIPSLKSSLEELPWAGAIRVTIACPREHVGCFQR